jgi:NCAIR mutase (PurE)-related protein
LTMDRKSIERLLKKVKSGEISIGEALEELRSLPYEDMGFAKPDTHRALRRDFPEVVYCPGKTNKQIVEVLKRLSSNSGTVLATRASKGNYRAVNADLRGLKTKYFDKARMIVVGQMPPTKRGRVLVVTGGTSDIPVAEEAAVTAEAMGCGVERLYDVGVAGVHRLLDNRSKLEGADVLVVIAGMEGALPSVVAGLVDIPVIAVPTSIGYGASFDGLAALLAMMSSCSPGVAVVNIDNGFGAGYMAATIVRNSGNR